MHQAHSPKSEPNRAGPSWFFSPKIRVHQWSPSASFRQWEGDSSSVGGRNLTLFSKTRSVLWHRAEVRTFIVAMLPGPAAQRTARPTFSVDLCRFPGCAAIAVEDIRRGVRAA